MASRKETSLNEAALASEGRSRPLPGPRHTGLPNRGWSAVTAARRRLVCFSTRASGPGPAPGRIHTSQSLLIRLSPASKAKAGGRTGLELILDKVKSSSLFKKQNTERNREEGKGKSTKKGRRKETGSLIFLIVGHSPHFFP